MDFSSSPINIEQPEIRFALELIRSGAELARRVRVETSIQFHAKQDKSPVTLADFGVQAIAGALLERYFPKSSLVAEESSELLRRSEGEDLLHKVTGYVHSFFPGVKPTEVCKWIDRGQGAPESSFWTLDPIDGTKGFLRGGQYAIALALIRDGKVVLAALGCPELQVSAEVGSPAGLLALAVRGKGCWGTSLGGENPWARLRVSQCTDIAQARILDSMELSHKNTEKNQKIREKLGILPQPIPLDSQAKHAVLASGGAEIFFRTLPERNPDFREKIWDVAAGAMVIEEAGGRVTDLEGNAIDYSAGKVLLRNPGFVATNGFFHDAVLEALPKITV